MKRVSREEYLQSDRSSKISRQSKNDYEEIDKVLNQMQITYKANIEAQETYIDILKRRNKNINSNYIRMIYALFTENKANQICFEKQQSMLLNSDVEERLVRRYYARMIQMGIRKISFYWANSAHLEFLSPYIVKLARQIHSAFNDIYKIKTLEQHFTVLKMLFHENSAVEQKIYELLIDQGYIFSMDEFYRINGVDLVSDRQYESKKESMKSIKLNKFKNGKQKQNKKQWSYSKTSTPESNPYTQVQAEKNKTKIKTMLESMVKELKTTIEQQKEANQLEVIEEENDTNPKSQMKLEEEQQEQEIKINRDKTKKRISKPENEYRRRVNDKKMSIELMSYFSNELKSAISEVQEVGIDYLSELLMTSESNSKPMEKVLMKLNPNDSPCIHSLKSLDSLKRIKEQRKRGKLIDMVLKKNNADNMSQMYDEVSQNNNFDPPLSLRHKFSFRSAPGMYISLPKKQRESSHMKTSDKGSKKSPSSNNRVIIKQNFGKDHIFENQLIVNELANRQMPNLGQKINFTQVNGSNLNVGIVSFNAWPSIFKRKNHLPQNKSIFNQLQSVRTQGSQSSQKQSVKQLNLNQKMKEIKRDRIKNEIEDESDTEAQHIEDLPNGNTKARNFKILKRINYSIYDRIRRRVIIIK